MANKKETKNKNVHEIVIKIDGDAWKEALDKAFNEKKKDAKVDGFRKGKVPKNIYIKKYGIESLFIPAADLVLQDAYTKAMEESKLLPLLPLLFQELFLNPYIFLHLPQA